MSRFKYFIGRQYTEEGNATFAVVHRGSDFHSFLVMPDYIWYKFPFSGNRPVVDMDAMTWGLVIEGFNTASVEETLEDLSEMPDKWGTDIDLLNPMMTVDYDGSDTMFYRELLRRLWSEDPMEPIEGSIRHCGNVHIISDRYEQVEIYSGGRGGYHSHHGVYQNRPVPEYRGYRVGIELEVECFGESDFNALTDVESNWFYHERDGSLGDYGDEIITVPLRPSDAKSPEFWKPLIDVAKEHAESLHMPTTGLHAHFSRSILGVTAEQRSETTGKLLYFYHHLLSEDVHGSAVNEKIFGRAHTYHEMDCKTEEGDAVKVLGNEVLENAGVCNKINSAMVDKASEGRYCDINILPSSTIEFRKGKGSIDAVHIATVVAWCETMVLYCRKHAWKDLSLEDFFDEARNNALLKPYI